MIAGIDPSTKSLGLALVDGTTLTVSPHAGAADRDRRLNELEALVVRHLRRRPPLPRLVVLEGPANHSVGIVSTIAVAEVRAVIRLGLWRLDVPSIEIGPSTLKRYATGNGNATKDAMVDASRVLAEDLGHPLPRNDDEADAYLLRHFARAAYGLEALELPHRIETVAHLLEKTHLPQIGTP